MGREQQGVRSGGRRYQLIPRTLCFIFHQSDLLLLKGAPDKRLWANLYNGIGGHVERGEDLATAARREIHEETGLSVRNLRLCGLVTVDVESEVGIGMAVFSALATDRALAPSAEGRLFWFPLDDLPQAELVEDLPALLERILQASPADPPFCAHFHYDREDRLVMQFAKQALNQHRRLAQNPP